MSEDKKDVKEEDKKEEVSESSPEIDSEFDYDAIFGESDNKIPYSRFKEVNDEKKALKAELDEVKSNINKQIEDAMLKEQMKQMTNKQDEYSLDDLIPNAGNEDISVLKQELASLKNQLNSVSAYTEKNVLAQQIKDVKNSFPSMNEEHVLALKKMHPKATIEECAKYSHDQTAKHISEKWKQMVEAKKADKENKTVTGAERIRNFKPEKPCETLAEAREALMKNMKE